MSMNVLGSTGTNNMLGMLSSGKQTSADAIISANIKASRERVNKLIEKYTNVSMKTDTEKYEKVAKEAKNTEEFLDALKKPELYEENAETVDKMTSKFADKYNALITSMKELGGNIEKIYGPKLTETFTKNEKALLEIGLSMENDGKIKKKEAAEKPVETGKIKAVFGETGDYGKQVKNVLADATDILTKALKIKQAQTSNYGKTGSYVNQLINNAYIDTKA